MLIILVQKSSPSIRHLCNRFHFTLLLFLFFFSLYFTLKSFLKFFFSLCFCFVAIESAAVSLSLTQFLLSFERTATLLNPPPSPCLLSPPTSLCRNSADLNWRVRPKCFNCPSPGNWCPDREGRSPRGLQRARETSLTPPRLETINAGHRLQFNRIYRWRSKWDRSSY